MPEPDPNGLTYGVTDLNRDPEGNCHPVTYWYGYRITDGDTYGIAYVDPNADRGPYRYPDPRTRSTDLNWC